ncbi:MAG: coenzyme F420 hydrogenase [Verrucomicrobia bacterium]|nr:MAG: coenzyme F420 hydrogenase [Verrucomicrobiota bacterium]
MTVAQKLQDDVVAGGICTGCGACVALDPAGRARMVDTPLGPQPDFAGADLPELAWQVCPGKGVDYAALYHAHYGQLPENWLLGCHQRVRTGHSADETIRRAGASGGVITHTLIYLLENKLVDAAIVVRQGVPEPLLARAVIARSRAEILAAAQSVYIPVATLDLLPQLTPGERYALVCLPDQAAALRQLQHAGHPAAQQIKFVLGPYTGTALYPAAITCFLRSRRVPKNDVVTSLKWRAGEWPGYLEIRTAAGRVLTSKKIYYNFLIPFFITQNSLQSMDFTNEFCDLSVGDAWSPRFEALGGGHSVITTRTPEMEAIIAAMERTGLLKTEPEDAAASLAMHGHMLDFKKRGSYIRNRLRRRFGRAAPEYGLRPDPLPKSRWAVEFVVSFLFLVGGTRVARKILEWIPESVIGPLFNRLRLLWKGWSKPVKRKGLGTLTLTPVSKLGKID